MLLFSFEEEENKKWEKKQKSFINELHCVVDECGKRKWPDFKCIKFFFLSFILMCLKFLKKKSHSRSWKRRNGELKVKSKKQTSLKSAKVAPLMRRRNFRNKRSKKKNRKKKREITKRIEANKELSEFHIRNGLHAMLKTLKSTETNLHKSTSSSSSSSFFLPFLKSIFDYFSLTLFTFYFVPITLWRIHMMFLHPTNPPRTILQMPNEKWIKRMENKAFQTEGVSSVEVKSLFCVCFFCFVFSIYGKVHVSSFALCMTNKRKI